LFVVVVVVDVVDVVVVVVVVILLPLVLLISLLFSSFKLYYFRDDVVGADRALGFIQLTDITNIDVTYENLKV